MNSELQHQLYGGEISDYLQPKNTQSQIFEGGIDSDAARELEQIYSTQIKGKPSIDTTGIFSSNRISPPFERDPHFDKLDHQLKNTLNAIAQQLNLGSDSSSQPLKTKAVTIQQQTDNDIAQANSNVEQALKELIQLKAI
jgi:hypothetical protein